MFDKVIFYADNDYTYINISDLFNQAEEILTKDKSSDNLDEILEDLDLIINNFNEVRLGIKKHFLKELSICIKDFVNSNKVLTQEIIANFLKESYKQLIEKEFGNLADNLNKELEINKEEIKIERKLIKEVDNEKKWLCDLLIGAGALGIGLLMRNFAERTTGKTGKLIGTVVGGFIGAAVGSGLGEDFILKNQELKLVIDVDKIIKHAEKVVNNNFNNLLNSIENEILAKAKNYRDKIMLTIEKKEEN